MNIKDIKGLKYPDEYFIKFFFKYGLHNVSNQTYLELGCSNGCNLMLPYQFDNHVIGIDLDDGLIEDANHNFELLKQDTKYSFHIDDMRDFCESKDSIDADSLILANSIYYIPKSDFIKVLQNIKKNSLIKKNIPFFIRFRLPDDFRNKSGKKIDENSIIIQNGTTGEDGLFCKFYEVYEMIELLQKELDLRDFQSMNITYENIQNNIKVRNKDAVIWGMIN